MKTIEAKTLEEAYAKAAEYFQCSVTDLEYEIVQHPSKGLLGLGAKHAVIVADCKRSTPSASRPTPDRAPARRQKAPVRPAEEPSPESSPDPVAPSPRPEASSSVEAVSTPDSANEIVDGFFAEENIGGDFKIAASNDRALSHEIEEELKRLMRTTCFDIDTVEVDVIEGTAYIFIDGEDAALLIGKEGYRYNALSYLFYNWIHNRYNLFVKLEIAQFLASQQEMIRNYIQPVVEHVHRTGSGKTRPLDGILVQIALEQLREAFPDKYVAIKRTRTGERYVLINAFNKRT